MSNKKTRGAVVGPTLDALFEERDALKAEVEAERLHTNNALAEVRRLSERNAELVEALRAVEKVAAGFHDIEGVTYTEAEALFNRVRAALYVKREVGGGRPDRLEER